MNQARNFEDVFVNVIASDHCLTRKEDSVIVVATWLVASSSSASILTATDLGGARFAHVKRRGNHLVRVRLNGLHSAKIKSMKISSGGSGGILVKFCTSENFLLYIQY